MNAFGVFAYLVAFSMFASICWALVLVDGPLVVFPKIVWLGFLIVSCMSVGHYLAFLIALSYGLSFEPSPIPWMDEPFKAAGVMFSTLLAGGGFSFGAYSFLKSVKVFSRRSADSTKLNA